MEQELFSQLFVKQAPARTSSFTSKYHSKEQALSDLLYPVFVRLSPFLITEPQARAKLNFHQLLAYEIFLIKV